ncbi:hypothetical protein ABVG11_21265 [Streptomyces sp. HD1123-B1]|uniref:hypothetical protein n=1 Tax=Streptomyces huangiella TaxID=3228804 RepID=UPI003D7E1B8A
MHLARPLVALAITGAGVLVLAAPAQAAPSVRFEPVNNGSGYTVTIYANSHKAGYARWYEDADALCVNDTASDGYWIASSLDKLNGGFELAINTSGHTAPYKDCVSKNLPDGTKYRMAVALREGDTWYSSTRVTVTA